MYACYGGVELIHAVRLYSSASMSSVWGGEEVW